MQIFIQKKLTKESGGTLAGFDALSLGIADVLGLAVAAGLANHRAVGTGRAG